MTFLKITVASTYDQQKTDLLDFHEILKRTSEKKCIYVTINPQAFKQ